MRYILENRHASRFPDRVRRPGVLIAGARDSASCMMTPRVSAPQPGQRMSMPDGLGGQARPPSGGRLERLRWACSLLPSFRLLPKILPFLVVGIEDLLVFTERLLYNLALTLGKVLVSFQELELGFEGTKAPIGLGAEEPEIPRREERAPRG